MIYQFIPILFTCFNLFFGFLSILFSLRENLILSGWFIIFAIFLDIIEAKIAGLSLSKKISEFGKEFVSLACLISFGLAPLVLVYKNFDQFYFWWISILFLYLACSAVRLARFNIYTKKEISSYFRGLPITVSAGFISVTVILIKRYSTGIKPQTLGILIFILSLLVISKIKYPNFQGLENKKVILFLIIGLVLLNILGESAIWFIFFAYILSPFLIKGSEIGNSLFFAKILKQGSKS